MIGTILKRRYKTRIWRPNSFHRSKVKSMRIYLMMSGETFSNQSLIRMTSLRRTALITWLQEVARLFTINRRTRRQAAKNVSSSSSEELASSRVWLKVRSSLLVAGQCVAIIVIRRCIGLLMRVGWHLSTTCLFEIITQTSSSYARDWHKVRVVAHMHVNVSLSPSPT